MATENLDFGAIRGGLAERILRALGRWEARYRERARLAALEHAVLHDMGTKAGPAGEGGRPAGGA